MGKKNLEKYAGQSIQDLIAMRETHRTESLVKAVEQGLILKPENELSEPEKVVLVIQSMLREVDNGGYMSFFLNSSLEFSEGVVLALEQIGCPKLAGISRDAIKVLKLPDRFGPKDVDRAVSSLSDQSKEELKVCDSRYKATEEYVGLQLFAFIEKNHQEIRIPNGTQEIDSWSVSGFDYDDHIQQAVALMILAGTVLVWWFFSPTNPFITEILRVIGAIAVLWYGLLSKGFGEPFAFIDGFRDLGKILFRRRK